METNKLTGLIYKVQPYKETSKLLFLYTPVGKLSFIATGSQSIKSSSRTYSQYLTLLKFDKPNKFDKLNKLINVEVINDYSQLKTNYHLTKKAGALLELINSCVYDDENHQKIFEQLTIALNNINKDTSYLIFSLRLLIILGYHFDFPRKKGMPLGYSISENTLIYDNSNNFDLSFTNTELMLKLIVSKNDDEIMITSEQLSSLNSFVKQYYSYHLQVNLKLIEV